MIITDDAHDISELQLSFRVRTVSEYSYDRQASIMRRKEKTKSLRKHRSTNSDEGRKGANDSLNSSLNSTAEEVNKSLNSTATEEEVVETLTDDGPPRTIPFLSCIRLHTAIPVRYMYAN